MMWNVVSWRKVGDVMCEVTLNRNLLFLSREREIESVLHSFPHSTPHTASPPPTAHLTFGVLSNEDDECALSS